MMQGFPSLERDFIIIVFSALGLHMSDFPVMYLVLISKFFFERHETSTD